MIKVRLHRKEAKAPTVAHPGEDLGYDVYAAENVTIPARGGAVVPTGVSVELISDAEGKPMGALIRDRSSMAVKHIIATAGVIDAGYRGEIRIVMENLGASDFEIHAGDKVANLIPYPVLTSTVEVVEELAESGRGAGGFGSTGRK
jgi:dUTP pyrophosphatase